MAPDSAVTGSAVGHGEVMASVDDGCFLIADVSRDEAWLAMSRTEAPTLDGYR